MPSPDRQGRLAAINVPELSPADDAFTHLVTQTPLDWIRLSGVPANAIERNVRGVKLSRYRAALQAALAVQPGRFVISHLPLMSAAVSQAMAMLRRRAPHLAFAFNFTTLPDGMRLRYMRQALARVDQFTIFSQHERALYSNLFGIEPERFVPVMWTQDAPPVQAEPGLAGDQPYLCAIGGEGRDFAMLMETARRLGPAVKMVVIARPHSLGSVSVPDHVEVLANIPLARVWRIATDSLGVLVPLKARETCCGHITLVATKLLGLPMITTHAYATREYVEGREAVLECEPGDVAAFTALAQRLVDERDVMRAAAQKAIPHERDVHDRRHWADHLDAFIHAKVAAGG
jgi:hypothetical protein